MAEDLSLIPDRYPQQDLFICDVADAVLKDILQEMEHPFYSLSKKPDTAIRRYEHNGNSIEITPSVKGLATIYDKDILIYCISQIMHKLKEGRPISKTVGINSRDLLMFTNRGTGGKDYKALIDSLDRLEGTRIRTTIRTGGTEQITGFGLIDTTGLKRKQGLDGRLLWCEVTLSDWVFNAIQANEVLTLHRDYFRLRKPLEKRIYEVARKHCGHQPTWKVSLELLLKKTGAKTIPRNFRVMLKKIAQSDHLPDYSIEFHSDDDMITFINRETMATPQAADNSTIDGMPILKPETFNEARSVAPSYDIYYLEQEWRNWWVESGKPALQRPDKAFVGFCKERYRKNPSP